MIAMSESTMIAGANVCAASGKSGTANRMKPYAPSFSMIAARITEPAVGASVWASGSQVWNGNIGTLIANARKKAMNAPSCSPSEKPPPGVVANARRFSKSKAPAQLPVASW